ncbi:hypothetical protein Zm00014a_035008 [Zea mays]|uniref:Uncharacterized protein n=1 Tax=Zea mays TaxID=4577 RepID=A0A3L6GD03_MAIZE|nr:hypothetical protein Zm00014a_035008 [Zea mays]
MSGYFNPGPYSQTECSIYRPLINFIRLGQISHVRTELKTPVSTAILNITICLLRLKSKADQISGRFMFESRVGNYFRAKSN